MSKPKWGESFLKSGLPLEHLAHVTFRDLGWYCRPSVEALRPNREGEPRFFELDLDATCPTTNGNTELSFFVECKYHNLSRYWMFLPHVAQGRWQFDDRVLNCGPFDTLKKPRANELLGLAPLSSHGIVVAEDGTKQDNAVYAAVQQIANAFVPLALEKMFEYNIDFYNLTAEIDPREFEPTATAQVPAVVTNARLFRLRPDVTDLDRIRESTEPADIADEVPWTWCYHDASLALVEQNERAIEKHKAAAAELVHRFTGVAERMHSFTDRPNWIAIINIKHLAAAVRMIQSRFANIQTMPVNRIIRPPKKRVQRK
jgi:hypothetical protein